jgi:hypothetical protein
VLPGAIVDNGSNNTVEFSTCYVNIDGNEFSNSTYIFEDTVMDIDQGGGTRTVTFGNLLTVGNTSLNTVVVRSSAGVESVVQGSLLINNDALRLGTNQNIHLGFVRIADLDSTTLVL